jgi:hypothetical protein
MQSIINSLRPEEIVANHIHQALIAHVAINMPSEGGSVPGTFGQFEFKITNTDSHFNVFIHKNRAIFKVDHFVKEDRNEFEHTFCKAFNIKRETVDNVLKAYLDVAKNMSSSGILSIVQNDFEPVASNPVAYISFKSKYAQDDVCCRCNIAQLKFNQAYKKNKRYSHIKVSLIKSQLHFYIDQHNNLKPIFIVDTWFDQDYAASFIVDVYADAVYTTRQVFAARSYEDLISMSRPINKDQLLEIMEAQFISRLLPVIKQRYGFKKDQIDLTNTEMRDRYLSLLMMESI